MTATRDRLLELLTDRALVGLGQREQIELAELLVKIQDVDIAAFDNAAAAVALATLGPIDPMPASLAGRLEQAALDTPARPASDYMTTRQLDKLAPGLVRTQVDEILEADSADAASSRPAIEPEEESLDYKKTLTLPQSVDEATERRAARPGLLTQEPESIATLTRPNDPYVARPIATTPRPFAPAPAPLPTPLVPSPAAPPGHASSPAQPAAAPHPSSPVQPGAAPYASAPVQPGASPYPSAPHVSAAPALAQPRPHRSQSSGPAPARYRGSPGSPGSPGAPGASGAPRTPSPSPPFSNVVPFSAASAAPAARGPSRAFAIAGWALAAACLVLAIGAFARRTSPAPVATLPTGTQPTSTALAIPTSSAPASAQLATLTPGELRDKLLAADGTARAEWTPTKDPLGKTATGEVVWNKDQQKGVMRFRGLAKNDPSRAQYQLWIFDKTRDEKYPVDGGVFDVDSETGDVVVPIRATLAVNAPVLFAVTLEKPGGVVVSKRDRIVVTAKLPTG